MKKLLTLATFLFVIAATSAFAQTDDDTRVIEASNDFVEIKTAFQKRVHDASLNFKNFFHEKSPFDIDGKQSELFNKKAHKTISKNKYFIFDLGKYFLFFVNKEDGIAIVFFFTNSSILSPTPCSQAEIDKALGLYLLES
jgi:uncharacterized protein YxeA